MINGILNIKKEKGFTSHDVVAKKSDIRELLIRMQRVFCRYVLEKLPAFVIK